MQHLAAATEPCPVSRPIPRFAPPKMVAHSSHAGSLWLPLPMRGSHWVLSFKSAPDAGEDGVRRLEQGGMCLFFCGLPTQFHAM